MKLTDILKQVIKEDVNPYEDPFNPFEETKIAQEVVNEIIEKLKSAFSRYRETADKRAEYMDSDAFGPGDLNYIINEMANHYITIRDVKDNYYVGDEIFVEVKRKEEGVYKVLIGDIHYVRYKNTLENPLNRNNFLSI